MKDLKTIEGNSFLQIAILVEDAVLKLESKRNNQNITDDNYLMLKLFFLNLAKKTKQEIEQKSFQYIKSKSSHTRGEV